MFGVPVGSIDFPQVEAFCRTYPEGVRVEYKREPAHIAKVVSSFANTVGGIWVIGVQTDPTTNRPQPPIEGLENQPGIQERIVQACHTGIYPALTPSTRVIEVPGRSGRIVVVVKVPESIEAPHAIENSTQVYVRVASTSHPYELADLDRIAYLIKRREQPERRREELIALLVGRAPGAFRVHLRVVVSPVYARGPIETPEDLYTRAETIERGPYHPTTYLLRGLRRVEQGILASRATVPQISHHLEINIAGVVFFDENAEPEGTKLKTGGIQNYFRLVHFVRPLSDVLYLADRLLPKNVITNMLASIELRGAQGISYRPWIYAAHAPPDFERILQESVCLGEVVRAEAYFRREYLQEETLRVMAELLRQILWAFNFEEDNLEQKIRQLLKL